MALTLTINGERQIFDQLNPGANLNLLLQVLQLQSDRIALELNGQIMPRAGWDGAVLRENDRIEMVHFVGGG